MELQLDWMQPVALQNGAERNLTYTCDLSDLPEKSGIYIFGRRFGSSFEALYVGKAQSIRSRIKTQLNNNRLMNHVRTARNGERLLLLGQFIAGPGQRTATCLPIIEHALIRHFLERGDDLVNVHGTRLRTHEIRSSGSGGRHGIPVKIVVDR